MHVGARCLHVHHAGKYLRFHCLPKSTTFHIIINLLRGQFSVETDEAYQLGLRTLHFGALAEERLDLKSL